jgi:hypothetical protein
MYIYHPQLTPYQFSTKSPSPPQSPILPSPSNTNTRQIDSIVEEFKEVLSKKNMEIFQLQSKVKDLNLQIMNSPPVTMVMSYTIIVNMYKKRPKRGIFVNMNPHVYWVVFLIGFLIGK